MSGTPFYIANAFTTEPFGSNPAALVLVENFPDKATMAGISQNLNQPMTAFTRPARSDAHTADFDVRWFSCGKEIPLCGHATLASAHILFTVPGLVAPTVDLLNFHSTAGMVLTAHKDGEWIELTLSATVTQALPAKEVERIQAIASRGLGKPVTVKYAGKGQKNFDYYLLVEIAEADDLANCKLNAQAFVSPCLAR